MILGSAFFGGFAIFLISNALEGKYYDYWILLLGAFMGMFSLASILPILYYTKVTIRGEVISLRYLFGSKIISKDQILYYTENDKADKLQLYTTQGKFTLYAWAYKNYFELMFALTKGKKNKTITPNLQAAKEKNDFYGKVIYYSVMCIFLFGAFYFYSKRDEEKFAHHELHSLMGTVSIQPQINNGSKGSKYVHLHLREYPEFVFSISGVALQATDAYTFVTETKVGDKIWVDIDKEDYGKKIAKDEPLGFFDKHINYSIIGIYGLRNDQRGYLTLYGYNKANKEDKAWGIWGCLGLALYMSYEYWKITKPSVKKKVKSRL